MFRFLFLGTAQARRSQESAGAPCSHLKLLLLFRGFAEREPYEDAVFVNGWPVLCQGTRMDFSLPPAAKSKARQLTLKHEQAQFPCMTPTLNGIPAAQPSSASQSPVALNLPETRPHFKLPHLLYSRTPHKKLRQGA